MITGPLTDAGAGAILCADHLAFSYGRTPALRGASISISRGEIVALVGPSGSGKSTMLYCLAGLTQPDSGTVLFEGRDITRMSDAERTELRRTSFGFVLQFGHLVPDLTLTQNVSLPLMLRGTSRARAEKEARTSLEALGLTEELDRCPEEVSGGQRQRAAVARALIGKPAMVFADEPTGALDTANGDRVMSLLTRGARTLGTSVVLVTHDPSRLDAVDRIVHLRDGATEAPRSAA